MHGELLSIMVSYLIVWLWLRQLTINPVGGQAGQPADVQLHWQY